MTTPIQAEMRNRAAGAIARGLSVIVVNAATKTPFKRTKGLPGATSKTPTRNLEIVGRLLEAHGDSAAVAAVFGPIEGGEYAFAIDYDAPEKATTSREQNHLYASSVRDDVAEAYGLGPTFEQVSKSGCVQQWFRSPSPVPARVPGKFQGIAHVEILGITGTGTPEYALLYKAIDRELALATAALLEAIGTVAPAREPSSAAPVAVDHRAALAWAEDHLKSLGNVAEGNRNNTLNNAAVRIRERGLPYGQAAPLLQSWGEAAGLDPDGTAATIRSAYSSNKIAEGSAAPEAVFKPMPTQPAGREQFKPAPRTALALIKAEFKPVMFTIENLLPEGVFLLVASPKVGKSWLALQFSLAVASGGTVLGERAKGGDVLVLALEDNDRRLQSRLGKLNAPALPAAALERLTFMTEWPRVDAGGAEAIDQWLLAHPGARLVVVDVLERIRPARDAKANAYGEDYKALQALKAIAEARRVSVLVVHHTRKAAADDALQLVSGTQGLAGAADGVLVLARPRGEARGELHVSGRDLEREGAFAVEFSRCSWQMIGPAGQVAKTALQRSILEALKQRGSPMGQSEIAQEVNRTRQTVAQALKTMTREGSAQFADGRYAPAIHTTDTTASSFSVAGVAGTAGTASEKVGEAVDAVGSSGRARSALDIFR